LGTAAGTFAAQLGGKGDRLWIVLLEVFLDDSRWRVYETDVKVALCITSTRRMLLSGTDAASEPVANFEPTTLAPRRPETKMRRFIYSLPSRIQSISLKTPDGALSSDTLVGR
jgi:hypothetical protein